MYHPADMEACLKGVIDYRWSVVGQQMAQCWMGVGEANEPSYKDRERGAALNDAAQCAAAAAARTRSSIMQLPHC